MVEVIDQLDLSAMVKSYRGSGSASYHPAMLLGLLIYGYATKVFSSRAIERATYDSVAFRHIAGNEHPDHDTIAAFRKRFLPQIEALFVEVLKLARDGGLEARHGGARRDEGARQREPAQRAVLRACEEARETAEAGGERAPEGGRASRCRRHSGWDVDTGGA